MNRDRALELLRGGPDGVAEWNEWRAGGGDPPFLSAADLRSADLRGADLRFVSLALARLDEANLNEADLSGGSIRQADFFQASLEGAVLANADARAADLSSADLTAIDAGGADFTGADLSGCRLFGSNLLGADLTGTNLKYSDLSESDLRGAHLVATHLYASRFTEARFGGTVICCSLAGVTDLEQTVHDMPSQISVSSVLSLTGIPAVDFLRGCGLRREEIEHFKSVLIDRIHFNSCFLSYHQDDAALAERLHRDLQDAGVRCWMRKHVGSEYGLSSSGDIERTNCGIDRLVLLLSPSSTASLSIQRDIDWALAQEDTRRKNARKNKQPSEGVLSPILIPIAVDNEAVNGWSHPSRDAVAERIEANAMNWDQQTDVYHSLLSHLLRVLQPQPMTPADVPSSP